MLKAPSAASDHSEVILELIEHGGSLGLGCVCDKAPVLELESRCKLLEMPIALVPVRCLDLEYLVGGDNGIQLLDTVGN